MDIRDRSPSSDSALIVRMSRSNGNALRRQVADWSGIQAELIEILKAQPFEYSTRSSYHTLVVAERGSRFDGETMIEGAVRSTVRDLNRRLCFVPAGRRFYGWQKPNVPVHVTYIRIDPCAPALNPELRFSEIEFAPRLLFRDSDLLQTALKVKRQIGKPASRTYAEALGAVLAHEIVRMNDASTAQPTHSGGLAGWQQKRLEEYIAEHIGSDISVVDLAKVAQLTPFHFTRAFKQTFGDPPHRYLVYRRIELAKELLGNPSSSVSEIAQAVGFAEATSLTAAFRRTIGTTPTAYRRSIA